MFGTSRNRYDRFNSGPTSTEGTSRPPQRETPKSSPICEADVTSPDVLGLDPIRIRGEPKPATYLQVNSDGSVSSKILRSPSRDISSSKVFSRFSGRSNPKNQGQPTIGQGGAEPSRGGQSAVPKESGSILTAMNLPPPAMTLPSETERDPLWDQKVDSTPDPSLSPIRSTTPVTRTFTPFFNNEFFITKDCRCELTGNSMNLVVELAGILSVAPKIYPFGNAQDVSIPNQPITLQFLGEENKEGIASGHLLSENGTITIVLDTYLNRTGETVSFEEIDLPVTLTFKGNLLV